MKDQTTQSPQGQLVSFPGPADQSTDASGTKSGEFALWDEKGLLRCPECRSSMFRIECRGGDDIRVHCVPCDLEIHQPTAGGAA